LDWLMRSSVGQKLVMAVTGVILSLFIVVHMLGNLSAFSSALAINQYGAALRKIPALLWGARIGLLAAAGLHIWMYLVLLFRSWSARPQGYRVTTYQESTLASRTMRWTGVILAAFVIYHLLHLTTGQVHPDFKAGDIYHNLVTGLQVVPVALFYIVAMVALGFHVFHGVWSLFQSLGISQPRYNSLGRYFATLFTFIVVAGFAAIPIAILAGLLR
jgi:succinate dehydrogenase / fumarate reductase cytochrome b subunit